MILLINVTCFAQSSTVILKSIDSNLYFTSALNGEIQHDVYVNNIKLSGISPNKKYELQIKFKGDTIPLKDSLYLMDVGFTHHYEIDKKNIRLKKITPTLNETIDPNQYLVVCEKPAPPIQTIEQPLIIEPDSSKIDYKMEGYEGDIGCEKPITNEVFTKFLLEIKKRSLEDEKTDFIYNQLSDQCLSTIQIDQFLLALTFEESKFDVLKFLLSTIHDIDRIKDLTFKHLSYESMRDEIQILKDKSYPSKKDE